MHVCQKLATFQSFWYKTNQRIIKCILNPINPKDGGGGTIMPPAINMFAALRVFVRFSPNLVTFPIMLLQII